MSNSNQVQVDLEWHWARRQAFELFDRFDALGLDEIAAGDGLSERSWSEFLSLYGLRRGAQAALAARRQDIHAALHPIYWLQPETDSPYQSLDRMWRAGTDALGGLAERRRIDGSPFEFRSMASKILWFYHPGRMTMYDDYGAKGLRRLHGSKVDVTNYLQAFGSVRRGLEEVLEAAASRGDRVYPYPGRLLDQHLWLMGSGRQERMLKLFRHSLQRAPMR